MAFTYGFYDSINHDRKYTAEQVSSLFDGLITDGVFDTIGSKFTTIPGNGLEVLVKPGKAWFNHTWSINDADLPLALDVPDITMKRIDMVALVINQSDSVRANSIEVFKGTPATNPVKPSVTNTAIYHVYPLSYVTVRGSTTSITSTDIENVVGMTATPFVTGLVEHVSIEALFSQWQGEFDEWFEQVQSLFSEDTIGNLQNQINARVKISDKATEAEAAAATNDTKWLTPKAAKSLVETNKVAVGDIVWGVKDPSLPGTFVPCDGRILTNPPSVIANALPGVMDNGYGKMISVGSNNKDEYVSTNSTVITYPLATDIVYDQSIGWYVISIFSRKTGTIVNISNMKGEIITSKSFSISSGYFTNVTHMDGKSVFVNGSFASSNASSFVNIIVVSSPTNDGITMKRVMSLTASSSNSSILLPICVVKVGTMYHLYIGYYTSGSVYIYKSSSLDTLSANSERSTANIGMPIGNGTHGIVALEYENRTYLCSSPGGSDRYLYISDITTGSPANSKYDIIPDYNSYVTIYPYATPTMIDGKIWRVFYIYNSNDSSKTRHMLLYGGPTGGFSQANISYAVNGPVVKGKDAYFIVQPSTTTMYVKFYLSGSNVVLDKSGSFIIDTPDSTGFTMGSGATDFQYAFNGGNVAIAGQRTDRYSTTMTFYSGAVAIYPPHYLDDISTINEKAYLKLSN